MRPSRDESKLPKYAQQELRRLRRDLEYFKNKLREGPEDSNTFADPFSDAPKPLGEDTIIQFQLNGSKVRVRIDGDVLDVNGGGRLAVYPRGGNAILIRPEGY
jgi:hypothetical protein